MKVATVKIPFTEEEISTIQDKIGEILRTGYLTMGKNVAELEKRFVDYIGTKYAIGVNTGFSALEICLRGIDIRDSSVIVPTNTSIATPYSVLHAGGKVMFADVLKKDFGMDPDDLRRKIREDTRAVVPVHIGGIISLRFREIQEICKEYNIPIIEDAAHAHGATIDGQRAGSMGLAGVFSFYATKVITCAEGGMIITDNDEVYKNALLLRNYGRPDFSINKHTEFGANFRFSEPHAAIGIEQIKKLGWMLDERRQMAELYNLKLEGREGINLVNIPENVESAYYKYIVYLEEGIDRDHVKKVLKEEYDLVLPAEVYAEPCHSQPVFKKYPEMMLNSPDEVFPGADYVCGRQICLPLYPGLREEEIDYVVDSLEKAVSRS